MQCRAALTLFFSIWALILKYWFWRLLYCPARPVDDTGMLLSRWQKGLREFSREAFGSSHTTNRRRTLHIDQKDKAEAAGRFYNSRRNECQITIHFFLQTCQSKSALFEFYQHEFSWLPPPTPSCKHCKIGAGGHETFQKPAFLQAGGGCACRLPFTAAPRFQFIALHALAGKALACSKWLGQGCTDRLVQ